MRRLKRRVREQNPVVRDDADRVAVDRREARHHGCSELALKLAEARAVDDARDDVPHVEGLAYVGADDAVEFISRVEWCVGRERGLSMSISGFLFLKF